MYSKISLVIQEVSTPLKDCIESERAGGADCGGSVVKAWCHR